MLSAHNVFSDGKCIVFNGQPKGREMIITKERNLMVVYSRKGLISCCPDIFAYIYLTRGSLSLVISSPFSRYHHSGSITSQRILRNQVSSLQPHGLLLSLMMWPLRIEGGEVVCSGEGRTNGSIIKKDLQWTVTVDVLFCLFFNCAFTVVCLVRGATYPQCSVWLFFTCWSHEETALNRV